MKLVIYPAVEPERHNRISASAAGVQVVNAADLEEALEHIPDAEAFFGKITPELLRAARRLRWVQTPTASLEHYMFPELVQHPCVLTNMRGIFSDVIADHVFGFIICFARNFHRYIRNQMNHRWQPVGGDQTPDFRTGAGVVIGPDRAHQHLGAAMLGIVGLGGIGSEVARRAVAHDMQVIAVDPLRTDAPAGVKAVWKPDRLGELLSQSDFVVIAAPHTPETAKMFGREQFRQMKRTAYLINIGRGAIVDLADLTAALEAGEIAGAGLDVYETEPLPADHPLWDMDNVILTPHVAGHSVHVPERHLAVLLDNIGRFTRAEPLRNIADKAQWF